MNKQYFKSIMSAAVSAVLFLQAVPVAASGETLSNDRYVYSFLTEELGLHHAAASGLMANIYKECAFVPTASCIDTNGRISYGLMQWNGPRFEKLKSFCQENGYGYDTLEGQLAYLEYDLNGPYRGYYDHLLYGIEDTEQGAYDAAYFWAAQYEVCSSSYFEQRANLAKDFYYPVFMEYAPVDAVMFGDEFYCVLTNAGTGLALTDGKEEPALKKADESGSQVWHFSRHGTETYTAVNCGTQQKLSCECGGDTWSFYKTSHGYMLECSSTGEVLGCSENGELQMQIGGGSAMQSYVVSEKTLPTASAEIRADYSDAPSVTEFTWDKAEGADCYRLKIYDGSSASGTPHRVYDSLKGCSYKISLPAGTYAAVVDSVNECGYTTSDAVTFTVGQQKPADLGKSFIAKISWNNGLHYLTGTESAEVLGREAVYEEEQVWNFVRNSDGSYNIHAFGNGNALMAGKDSVELGKLSDENQSWMIYGNEKDGYIIQLRDEQQVLSAAEKSEFEVRSYTEAAGQQFEIAGYTFEKPLLYADAGGGVLEPVQFTWDKADCAEGYILSVRDDEDCVIASVKIRDNDTEADITLREGSYTAEISAVSSITGESVNSSPVSFEVKNLPERPEAKLELNKKPGMITFGWNRCEGADIYSYRILEADSGDSVKYKKNVKGFSDDVSLDTGKYVIIVTAENEEGSISSYELPIELHETEDGEAAVSMKSILAAKKRSMADLKTE